MLARPEVKRTYSRLKKNEQNLDSISDIPLKDISGINDIFVDSLDGADGLKKEFSVVKPDKLRKITDFFRIKRDDETTISTDNTTITATTTNSNTPCSSPITSVSRKLTQTYLDLGQKNLVSMQCPECLMHYNKSFQDDLNLHKKFHSQYLKGYTFSLDPTRYRELAPPIEEHAKWSSFRFHAIDKFDGVVLRKMGFFLNFVHVQLGAEPITFEELKQPGRYSATLAVEHSTDIIVGFALFEGCHRKVYKSLVGCSESAIEIENNSDCSRESDLFHGVSRIWVDQKCRSKRIASLLLDLKCFGKRERIAFSQPTQSGFHFAKFYQRNVHGLKSQCLIYL